MTSSIRPVFESSAKVGETPKTIATIKYPWATITPGKSFAVQHNEIKLSTLRSYASRMQTKYKKKFRVIDHTADGVYEVACLPQTTEEVIASSSNVVEALNKIKENEE